MEGVDYFGFDGTDGYRISVWALYDFPYVGPISWFHGSITLEGVTVGGISDNQPFGNLNIIVSQHCDGIMNTGELVGNTGQTSISTVANLGNSDNAQAFTTGGHASGYKLTSVALGLFVGTGTKPTYTVSIRADSNGEPGTTALGTLTHPASLSNGVNMFTAPGDGIALAAGTTYWVLTDTTTGQSNTSLRMALTDSNNEDSGAATGWSIADGGRWRTWNTTAWTASSDSRQIEIHGYAKPLETDEPAPTVFTLTSNLGQAKDSHSWLHSVDVAQRFRTGSHAEGYDVTAVKLNLQVDTGASSSSFTVSIHKDAGGTVRVGDQVGSTLTNPQTLVDGENTFSTADSAAVIDLAPNTWYYVLVDASTSTTNIRVDQTSTNAEDPSAFAGWDIDRLGRNRAHGTTTGTWGQLSKELQIAIVGTEKST